MSVGDRAGQNANGGANRMAGVIDGVAVLPHPTDATKFWAFINHEMFASAGVVRAHGQAGAFVTHLTIDRNTLQVTNMSDLVSSPSNMFSVRDGWAFAPKTFARLCSSNIPPITGFFVVTGARCARISIITLCFCSHF
jgi:hypothetical protein